jgi:two-component system, OmpR family, sensor histidine kinase KdpD
MTKKNEPFFYEDIIAGGNNHQQATLFSKISHELKTPIHGISGIASFLSQNWDAMEDKTKKKYMSDIVKASEVLNDLVENFVHLSEISSQKVSFNFTEENLVDLIQISIDRCKTYLLQNKNLTVRFSNKIDKAFAQVDAFWFKQLMTNLLANAVTYSEEGTISVGLDITNFAGSEYYIIFVQDEGKGIPEGEIDTIFNEFTRASKEPTSSKNFGLGLAICKEIVENHGGKIWAKNNQLKGAQIIFTIPVN